MYLPGTVHAKRLSSSILGAAISFPGKSAENTTTRMYVPMPRFKLLRIFANGTMVIMRA